MDADVLDSNSDVLLLASEVSFRTFVEITAARASVMFPSEGVEVGVSEAT